MRSRYIPKRGIIHDEFFYITNRGELITFEPGPEDEGFSVETKLYSLHEMVTLMEFALLTFKAAYGSIELPPEEYGVNSELMVIVGEKGRSREGERKDR